MKLNIALKNDSLWTYCQETKDFSFSNKMHPAKKYHFFNLLKCWTKSPNL